MKPHGVLLDLATFENHVKRPRREPDKPLKNYFLRPVWKAGVLLCENELPSVTGASVVNVLKPELGMSCGIDFEILL